MPTGIAYDASQPIGKLGGLDLSWDAEIQYYTAAYAITEEGVWKALRPNKGVAPTGGDDWELVIATSGAFLPGLDYSAPCLTVAPSEDNQVVICGSATGDPVTISAVGSDLKLALHLSGKGVYGVWVSGGDSTSMLIDHGNNHADIAFNESVPFAPALIVANDITGDGVLGLLAYRANNVDGVITRVVAIRGTPGSPVPALADDGVYRQTQYANLDTGGYSNTIVADYTSNVKLDGMGNAGADQTWSGYTATGASVGFLKYSADIVGDQSGSDALTLTTNAGVGLDLNENTPGAVTVSAALVVTTRTGTPAKFACFDVSGKLCEGDPV